MKTYQIGLLVIILLLVAGIILYFERVKNAAPVPETKIIGITVDISKGEKTIPELPNISEELMLRQPIEIHFSGVGAEQAFSQIFSTVDVCSNIETKQDRRAWWELNPQGQVKLEQIVADFKQWIIENPPFRNYGVAIDITEGFNGPFVISHYLSKDDIKWISSRKGFSLVIFAIGYNPIPGYITLNNNDAIEAAATEFLSKAPGVMGKTQLFSQLNFIFGKPFYKLVLETDLMENAEFSAYEYQGQKLDLGTFFPSMKDPSGKTEKMVFKGTSPSNLEFILVPPVTGIPGKYEDWFNFIKPALKEFFPGSKIVWR